MKRDFIFRAFDGEIMLFYEPQTDEEYDYEWVEFFFRKCQVMQFTGLYDKNGKGIYEGDIVQRGIITFSRGKFQGTYYDGRGDLAEDWEDDLFQERNIEVLGNIYENPELLQDDF